MPIDTTWAPDEVGKSPESWTPPEATGRPDSTPFDWDNQFSGLEGIDSRVSPSQQVAFKQLDKVTKNPQEARADSVTQAYWQMRMPNIPIATFHKNWPAMRKQIALFEYGIDKPEVSGVDLYTAEQQRREDERNPELTGEIKAAPNVVNRTLARVKNEIEGYFSNNKLEFEALSGIGEKRLLQLPEADAGNRTFTGPRAKFNQQRQDRQQHVYAIYNAVKPFIEQTASPVGAGTIEVGGTLQGLAKTYPIAKATLVSMTGLFAGLMAKGTYDAHVNRKAVMADPKSTPQQKYNATAAEVVNGLATITASLGTAFEMFQGKEAEGLAGRLKGKTPAEAAEILRTEAGAAKEETHAQALNKAADEIENVDIGQRSKTISEGTGVATPAEEELIKNWKAKIAQEKAEAVVQTPGAPPAVNPPFEEEGGTAVAEPTKPLSENPNEVADRAYLTAHAVRGSSLIEQGVSDEEWMKTMQTETGLDSDRLLLVKKMSGELMNPVSGINVRRLIEMRTGHGTTPLDFTGKAKLTLKNMASALLSQIGTMMDTHTALREFYKGQEQAAEGAAKATRATDLEQDRLGRAQAEDVRRSLLEMANTLPVKEQGRFIAAITDALKRPEIGGDFDMMYRRAAAVTMRILSRADELKLDSVISDISKIIKRVKDAPGVDIEYQKRINDIVARVGLRVPREDTIARLQATREYIAAKGENHGVPDDVVHQLEVLSQTPAKDLPINVLESMRDRMETIEELGKLKVRTRQALLKAEQDRLSLEIQLSDGQNLSEVETKRAPGEELGVLEKAKMALQNKAARAFNAAVKAGKTLLGRDVWMDIMDGGNKYRGAISRIFGGRIDAAFNARAQLFDSLTANLRDIVKRNGGYSQLERERIGIHAVAEQEDGLQRLLDSGVKPEVIKEIHGKLTTKEQEFYDAARKVMDETGLPAITKFMRDNYNMDVKPVKNYWPLQRDPTLVDRKLVEGETTVEPGSEVSFDEMAGWRQVEADYGRRPSTQAEKGFTKSRVPEAKGAVRLDGIDVVNAHLRDVAHLLTHQRDMMILGRIARSDDFAAKYGKPGQQYILNLLDTVSRDSSPAGATRNALMDWLTRQSSVAVLGFRVLSQLKHVPNLAIAMAEVRPDFLVRGMVHSLTDEGRLFLKKNFAEIAQRNGGETAIADLTGGKWGKAQRASFVIERGVDALLARATVMGKYFQELSRAGKQHSELSVDAEAQRMALVTARRVVTSPLRKDLPQAISRGALLGGNMSLTRVLTQFQTTMLRQYAYARHDIFDLGLRKLDARQFAAASLGFLAMLAGETTIVDANRKLLNAVASKKEDPKHPAEGFGHELVVEGLKRVPFAGNFMATKYGETGAPLVDTVVQGSRASIELASGTDQYGHKLSAKQKAQLETIAIGSAASFAGIPGTSTATQLIEKSQDKKRNTFTLRK